MINPFRGLKQQQVEIRLLFLLGLSAILFLNPLLLIQNFL